MVQWRSERRGLVLLVGALALMAALYAPLVHAGAVYEDENWQQALRSGLTWALPAAVANKPVAIWSLNAPLGLEHLINVWLHAMNGLLVFALALAVADPLAAGLAALIFLLTPLNSEAVAYLSARSDLLMTACALLGALATLRPGVWALCATLAVAAVAIWCDQVGLLVIPLALLTSTLLVRPSSWRDLRATALLVALAGGAAVIAPQVAVQWQLAYSPEGMNLAWSPFLTYQMTALWHLLALLADPRWLSIDHDIIHLGAGWTLWAASATAATLSALVLTWRRSPLTAWALGWLVLSVAPHFVFRTSEWVSEHQLYLALAGVSIGLGCGLSWLGPRVDVLSMQIGRACRRGGLSMLTHATRSA